jgi:general stress protein 26
MNLQEQQTPELAKVGELIERMRVAMLVTLDEEGVLRSRPLQTLEMDSQGHLWFFVSADSTKVAEVDTHEHQAYLSYADPGKQDYVSVSGVAWLVRNRERMQRLWTPWVKVWFPKGLDDPDLALLCFRVDKAEYWEAPSSSVKRMLGLARALTTGDKSDIGENEEIDAGRPEACAGAAEPIASKDTTTQ